MALAAALVPAEGAAVRVRQTHLRALLRLALVHAVGVHVADAVEALELVGGVRGGDAPARDQRELTMTTRIRSTSVPVGRI
jgi:hypothetical protein